jgi:hypothetical protein
VVGKPESRRPLAGLALLAALAWLPLPAAGAPDPAGALEAAVDMPLRAVGSALGGVGLVGASLLGLAGDALHAIDANRLTRPVLRGVFSDVVYRGAWLVSGVSTSALEALRGEDIERLPEARAAYLEAAPLVGRLDTALTGGAALRLAAGDLVAWPALVVLKLVGAENTAERLAASRTDARVSALGPSPLPSSD